MESILSLTDEDMKASLKMISSKEKAPSTGLMAKFTLVAGS